MLVCVRNEANDGLMNNSIISIALPKLKRTYLTMNHICGYNLASDGSIPSNCGIKLGRIDADDYLDLSIVYEVPSNNMYNDGSLNQMSRMFFDTISIPMINHGDRIGMFASFDTKYGGLGMDNIHLYTPQK